MSSISTNKLFIKDLQKIIDNLKTIEDKKLKKIDRCVKKCELRSFTTEELTNWLCKNKVNHRKIVKSTNNKYIDLVWDVLNDKAFYSESDSDSDSSDSDSSDSDSESDSSSESDWVSQIN